MRSLGGIESSRRLLSIVWAGVVSYCLNRLSGCEVEVLKVFRSASVLLAAAGMESQGAKTWYPHLRHGTLAVTVSIFWTCWHIPETTVRGRRTWPVWRDREVLAGEDCLLHRCYEKDKCNKYAGVSQERSSEMHGKWCCSSFEGPLGRRSKVLKTSKHRHSAAGVIQRRSGGLARIHGFHIAKSYNQKLRKTVTLGELLAGCLRSVLIGMQSSAALRSITAFSLGRYLSMACRVK